MSIAFLIVTYPFLYLMYLFRLRLGLRYDYYFLHNVAGGSDNTAMAKVEQVVSLSKIYLKKPFSSSPDTRFINHVVL